MEGDFLIDIEENPLVTFEMLPKIPRFPRNKGRIIPKEQRKDNSQRKKEG